MNIPVSVLTDSIAHGIKKRGILSLRSLKPFCSTECHIMKCISLYVLNVPLKL